MNESALKMLLEASAVKAVLVMAQGSLFHVEVKTAGGSKVLVTGRGDVRHWRSIDACAKWLRKIGIGQATIHIDQWHPDQKTLELSRNIQNAH